MSPKNDDKASRRRSGTREKIIEIAESLIARHGPDDFQLQNITDLLGLTPPAIYNHFKDRDELVAHVAEKGGRILAERMRTPAGEDVLTSLRRNARIYVRFLAENPAYPRLILWELSRHGTVAWPGLAASAITIRERMRVDFEKGAKEGVIRKVRVEFDLQYFYIGAAAASVWTDYDDPLSDLENFPGSIEKSPEEVERLMDEAEEFVVRMFSPEREDSKG